MKTPLETLQNEEMPIVRPTKKKRVMVAGVGNIFLQDDGFGTIVATELMKRDLPEGVEIHDFGTGGLKLAYDLMQGYDALILIDVSNRGEPPGTIYLIEPDESEIDPDLEKGGPIDPHGGDPATVLRFLKALNAWPAKVWIVACEASSVDEIKIGLSDAVEAVVDKTADMVLELVNEIYNQETTRHE